MLAGAGSPACSFRRFPSSASHSSSVRCRWHRCTETEYIDLFGLTYRGIGAAWRVSEKAGSAAGASGRTGAEGFLPEFYEQHGVQ